jgi:DNA polymerase-4
MALAAAQRQVKDLVVLPPDPPAYASMNRELERIAAVYAPAFENDQQGNLYLDLTGTSQLFGPPADCSSRILQEIAEQAGIRPAAAVAGNKPVGKVAPG